MSVEHFQQFSAEKVIQQRWRYIRDSFMSLLSKGKEVFFYR